MKNLKEFLIVKFREHPDFQAWKKKFPDMFAFSEEVHVVPWEEEFGIVDRHPEAIDEIEFYEELRKNGMISNEEFEEKLREIHKRYGTVSRTEGVAWIKRKEVSFRRRNPHLSTVLHELGHVYFEATDPIWSSIYGGGELLMWLIIKGKTEGNEESIRRWHEFIRYAYENPDLLLSILDKKAKITAQRLGIDLEEIVKLDYLPEGHPAYKHEIMKLMLFAGTLPHEDAEEQPQPILIGILEGIRWGEALYSELIKDLLS